MRVLCTSWASRKPPLRHLVHTKRCWVVCHSLLPVHLDPEDYCWQYIHSTVTGLIKHDGIFKCINLVNQKCKLKLGGL